MTISTSGSRPEGVAFNPPAADLPLANASADQIPPILRPATLSAARNLVSSTVR